MFPGPAMWGGASDPYRGSVRALLHCNDANGTAVPADSAGATWANPGPVGSISNAITHFGGNTFNHPRGSGGPQTTLTISNVAVDYTIEVFVRFNSLPAGPGLSDYLMQTGDNNAILYDSVGGLFVWCDIGGTYINTSFTPSLNTWYYLAIVGNSSSVKVYVDGSQVLNYGSRRNLRPSLLCSVGYATSGGGTGLNVNFDEYRLTIGVARDVSVVPTAPFPDA